MNVLVPLAAGFEEIEAVTIIDMLRRACIPVVTAALNSNPVTGSHDIVITADSLLANIDMQSISAIVLPGGMPGSAHLKESELLRKMIKHIYGSNGLIAAICAAPIVYGSMGILKNKKATCYPGFEPELTGALCSSEPVVCDGNIITAKGPGCAIPFTLTLIEVLKNTKTALDIQKSMQVYWMQ